MAFLLQDAFLEEVRMQGESWKRSRSQLLLRVDRSLLGYRKGGEAYEAFCLASFAVTLTSSEGTLKKKRHWFQGLLFFASLLSQLGWMEEVNVKLQCVVRQLMNVLTHRVLR